MNFLRQTNYKGWIMRLTSLLLALSVTGARLLAAGPASSQDISEVRVTLDLRGEPLKSAFSAIERQTAFRFAYSDRQVGKYRNITLAKANTSLQEVLRELLAGTQLAYKQVSNKIIVFKAEEAPQDTPADPATATTAPGDGTVKGTVMNSKGEGVPGASVLLISADRSITAPPGVAADAAGHYTISGVKPGKYQIQVTGVGFQNFTRSITVAADQTLDVPVSLKDESSSLNEVVVTGYSKQSKRDVTGAASTISADVVAQTPVTSVEGVLEGRVAGVSVDGQGGPGASQTIRIRGIGTLLNNDPLYVIDGVQIKLGTSGGSQDISNLLDPGEIESISILKDPSMTALYGAEGSNGVIVITTKTGKQGAPRLEYNSYVRMNVPKDLPSEITPQQQADALYNSYQVAGIAFPFGGFYPVNGNGVTLPAYIIEGSSTNVGVAAGDPAANPSLYDYQNYRIIKANQAGTNWWKALFKPSMTQNHQLTLSGANDRSNYAISVGYADDNGTLLNSYFKRLSLRVNTQFKIKPWLRLGENVEMSYATQNSLGRSPTGDIAALYVLSPLLPKNDIAGNPAGTNKALILGNTGNPYTDRVNALGNKSYNQSILGSAYLEVDPIKGLTYTNQIGFQFFPYEGHGYTPVQYQEPIPGTTNLFSEGGGYSTDWRWLNKLSYTKTLYGIHRVSAFVGYEASQFSARSYGGTTGNIGFPSFNTEYLGNGNSGPGTPYVPMVYGGGTLYTTTSLFGNITYSLMDKYLLTGTYRRDGSSTFGPDSRHGNFGAASFGWRMSSEKFMQGIKWLSDLKPRISYGSVGNDDGPGYSYLAVLKADNFGGYDLAGTNTSSMAGYYPYQLGNPKLHWESNVTINLGFDAGFFNNALTASFNWFDRKTNGLIFAPPSSGTAGSALSPLENVMKFSNKGIELELGYNGHIGRALKFDMNFNFSSYRNRVNFIDGIDSTFIQGGEFGSNNSIYLNRSTVGRPVSSFFGYVYNGLFQSSADVSGYANESHFGITATNGAGHIKYKDLNGDGVIDSKDQTYLGNPNPKFSYGYNLNLYFKHFDLGILLQGVYGNKIFNYGRTLSQFPGAIAAGQGGLAPAALDTWSPTNTNAKLPIFSQDLGPYDLSPASEFIESGSYMRIKSLQLGYTIPDIKGIRKIRIYIQAYNLLTITHYSGMDPEVNDGTPNNLGIDYGTAYPFSKQYLFGINLGL
jgi:TonB-dependent starch-binding outer membrane protein SusC